MGQLDVFLTNNPNQVINRDTKNEFNKSFNSDHDAFTVKIEAQTDMQSETKQHKFAFNKAHWKELNNYILENPFKPFCYSNIDELVKQWYTWLDDLLTKNHAAQIQPSPWIKKESSHLIKVISTLKRKTKNSNLGRLIKIKKAEKKLRDQLKQDQADFEDKIFRGRRFSDLQKYLKSVYKCNRYPETMSYKDYKTNEDS